MIDHVIWDWNGTLLNDAPFCVALTNDLLKQYGRPQIPSLEHYRRVFTFPVKDYYNTIGFGAEIFPTVAVAWMDGYMAGEHVCPLQPQAVETAALFRDAGIRQVIISASKLSNLEYQLQERPQFSFFDAPRGLSDIYAGSKVDIALQWMRDATAAPQHTALIGDTLHDAQVAKALGCRCILVSQGHQPPETLMQAGVPVVESLPKAAALVLDWHR